MEVEKDIGEEIISRLKELIEILENKRRISLDGKECPNTSLVRN